MHLGKDLVAFVDNQGAAAALLKGYARNSDALDAAAALHIIAARHDTRLWIEWVDSKANIIDGLSRSPSGGESWWRQVPAHLPPFQDLGAWKLERLLELFG